MSKEGDRKRGEGISRVTAEATAVMEIKVVIKVIVEVIVVSRTNNCKDGVAGLKSLC